MQKNFMIDSDFKNEEKAELTDIEKSNREESKQKHNLEETKILHE